MCDTPDKAAEYWRMHVATSPQFNPECECMVVILLNTRRRVKGHQLVSIGTMDSTVVHRATLGTVFRQLADWHAAAERRHKREKKKAKQ